MERRGFRSVGAGCIRSYKAGRHGTESHGEGSAGGNRRAAG